MSTIDLRGDEKQWVLEFPQPGEVVSENTFRRAAFSGHGASVGVKNKLKAWKESAFYAWKQARFGPCGEALGQACYVTVELGFHVSRARDPHNYVGTVVKSIVDGLVLAGLWPDDTPEWVYVREPILVVHERVPHTTALTCRVVLTLREG